MKAHEIYERLGYSEEGRQTAYRGLFSAHAEVGEMEQIRRATAQEAVLGNDRFREEIESTPGRRVAKYEHGGDRRSRQFREKQ